MGVCSYCGKYKPIHEECFGWDEAYACSGAVRPDAEEMKKLREKIMKRFARTLSYLAKH